MFCPICRAEYTRKATICSDCQVPLVEELPAQTAAVADSTPGHELFVPVWSGGEAGKHEEVLEILARENIPAKTIQGHDFFILASSHLPFEVYVPASFAQKAKTVLEREDSAELEAEEATGAGPLEIPAEEYSPENSEPIQHRPGWHPDDATAEIWSGEDTYIADMIALSLKENQIDCRFDSESADPESAPPASEKIFVLPEDEARAKEIVREIVDAAPPE